MNPSDAFYGERAQGFKNRRAPYAGITTLPGAYSDDPKHLKMTRNLVDRLNDALPSEVHDDGTGKANAVVSDFNALLNVAGYTSTMTCPIKDNTNFLIEEEIAERFKTPRHEAIFDEVFKLLLLSGTKPKNVQVSKISSAGFRTFSNDVGYKMKAISHAAEDLDGIFEYLNSGNLADLARKHNLALAFYVSRRSQPDRINFENGKHVPKVRYANDKVFALSNGEMGSRFEIDKTIPTLDAAHRDSHFAMRSRNVFAPPVALTYTISVAIAEYIEYFSQEYSFTIKHRGAEDIQEKLKGAKHVIGADVAAHDEKYMRWMLHLFIDKLPFNDNMKTMIKLTFSAPYYAPPRDRKDDGYWSADPFDIKSFNHSIGLPSGAGLHSVIAKVWMLTSYLIMADDYFHNVLEVGIHSILKGEHAWFKTLNMGDDALILTDNTDFYNHMTSMLNGNGGTAKPIDGEAEARFKKSRPSPYHIIEKEDGVTFLGNVITRNDLGEYRVYPNIVSDVVNWWVPERGTQNKSREYWAIGFEYRKLIFAKHPGYSKVKEIEEEEFYRQYKTLPSILARKHRKEPPVSLLGASQAEIAVATDPSKLQWLYDEDEIDPRIREQYVRTIPDDVCDMIREKTLI